MPFPPPPPPPQQRQQPPNAGRFPPPPPPPGANRAGARTFPPPPGGHRQRAPVPPTPPRFSAPPPPPRVQQQTRSHSHPQQQPFPPRPPPPPVSGGPPATNAPGVPFRPPPGPPPGGTIPPSSRYPVPPMGMPPATPGRSPVSAPPPGRYAQPPQLPPQPPHDNYQHQQQHQQQHPHPHAPHQHQRPQPMVSGSHRASNHILPRCPPLFTRSSVDGDETSTDAFLPTYFPRGCWTNADPAANEPAPPADSRFLSLDDGSAAPGFIRPTMYRLPSDRHVLRQAIGSGEHDCMGLLCSPMALPSMDHPPPPRGPLLRVDRRGEVAEEKEGDRILPDSGSAGRVPVDCTTNREAPPRCGRCYAYVNPFWSMSRCNFCHRSNRSQTQSQHGDKAGTVDYPVEGPYVTRETSPVRPHWVFCVDLTSPKAVDYVDLVLDEVWPAFYRDVVLPHTETTQGQHGRRVFAPRVAMVFVCSTGVYIPQKGGAGEDGPLSRDGFLVMPEVADGEAFSPMPLEEWSWSLPDEYDDMLHLWTSRIRPVLLPRLIDEKVRNYHKNTASTSQAERLGAYSMSPGGAALEFLVDALSETGGRAVFWTWRRPNYGIGALADRERLAGGNQRNKPKGGTSLYMPLQDATQSPQVKQDPNLREAAAFYKRLGERCARAKVALDIVVHTDPSVPRSFLDLATLGRLCEVSSGRLIWIGKPSYGATAAWKQAMLEEVLRPLYWSGWDAVFKIRCSQGLQVRAMASSAGNLLASSSLSSDEDELEFSVVTPETCIGVTLEHRVGGLPKPNNENNKFAYVQTALLYTNPWTGDRRVRVSTLAISVTDAATEVLPSMDFGALAALQLRLNLPHPNYSSAFMFSLDKNGADKSIDPSSPDQIGDRLLTDARHGMLTAMRQVLVAHRAMSSRHGGPPSMAPASLQQWPLFVMAALKSPLLRPSKPRQGQRSLAPSPGGDERAYYMYHARRASPACASLLVSPLLFDLGAASFEWKNAGSRYADATANLKNSPVVAMPSPTPASVSNLSADGIYLLDTCFNAYVIVEEGAECGDQGSDGLSQELEEKIHNAVQQLRLWSQVGREPRCLRPSAGLPVVVVRKTEDFVQYQELLKWMVLDATSHHQDFDSFCRFVSNEIQKQL